MIEIQMNNIRGINIIKGFIVVALIACIYSCNTDENPVDSADTYQYEIPEQVDDGWETASLSSVGINEFPLINLMNHLEQTSDHQIHSLLIVKDDKLVFEEYFPGEKFNLAQYTGEIGFDMDDTHNLCSATKSVTSALVGIAIDQGLIQSVDQKVFDFFPEHADILDSEPGKDDMTIEHLLAMQSGLAWDDETYSYFDPRNDMYQLFNSSDPLGYILAQPLIEPPGTVFAYRNCNTNVLGEIVRSATGLRLDVFSNSYLFRKLGITDFEWQGLPNGVVFCSGDLRLRPRDMAKFGYLFLNDGIWNDERLISEEWIDLSTSQSVSFYNDWADLDGYGYQWWLWEDIGNTEFSAYAASGWGGQWIIVSPNKNTVFVTTGGNYYTAETISIQAILANYIIPAI
jgi:CubicO group peptidase (beta-lactamase class C family)